MSIVKIYNIDLYYEVHGKGEPLLLIAGLASDSGSWLPVVDELSKYYSVITFDNRGVGRTEPQEVETSIPLIADDCISLIKHLGLSSCHILGHSMGGFIALDLAIRYSEYVSKLILVGTSAVNSKRNNYLFLDWISYLDRGMSTELWFRNIFYWIFSKHFFSDVDSFNNAVKLAVEYPYKQTKVAFINQVNAIKNFNCVKDLHKIISKTLVICGKEDLLFSPKESSEVLKLIPKVEFSYIEQAAHYVHMEKPEEFIKIVLNFLKENDEN